MIKNEEASLEQIADHYDELAELYQLLWGKHLHHGLWLTGNESKEEACENLAFKVLSNLGNLKNKNLIDIGSGYGETAKLACSLGCSSVVAFTVSKKQFNYSKRSSKGFPVKYLLQDWLQNNLEEESFDAAFSIECFSHIGDKNEFFNQIYKKLKPGGKFVMTAWLYEETSGHLQEQMLLKPICQEGRLPSLFTKEEVFKTIELSGLKLLDFNDLSEGVEKTWEVSLKNILKGLFKSTAIKYLFDNKKHEKKFVLSVLRIFLSYKTKCFRYGLFSIVKP